ncbi:nucleotidyltransferase family protein [Pseudothermotoga thermarum]|uniref:DNA polymerase beta domain protein region n=1 Tax=Pseudothermotoga thermarum DSM 5069 TaxID=688269 RepID=F7YVR6_9THEM|nr:nucleotidyltransferase [Pseudothermotoga thermarum]AEH51734.1 DNA polymerase beta domain protein region [Pseudothermotoga thermarum DSM 5069]
MRATGKKSVKLEDIKRILAENKKRLQEKYGIKEIAIFGSFARGDETSKSDIDILLEFERPIGWEFVDLCEELENLLGLKVDVLTKNALMSKPALWESIRKDIVYV